MYIENKKKLVFVFLSVIIFLGVGYLIRGKSFYQIVGKDNISQKKVAADIRPENITGQNSVSASVRSKVETLIEKNIDYNPEVCQGDLYDTNQLAKDYCLATLDISRCERNLSDASKNYCYLETAEAKKDVTICDNITILADKYVCKTFVARDTQDPKICYNLPSDASTLLGNTLDERAICFKGISALNPAVNSSLRKDKLISPDYGSGPGKNLCKGSNHEKTIVNVCGEYYSVSVADMADAGRGIFDKNENAVVGCGGMPFPGKGSPNKLCSIQCSSEDICRTAKIDCSVYDIPKEIPTDYWDQIAYYVKKSVYAYSGTTATAEVSICNNRNNNTPLDESLLIKDVYRGRFIESGN